MSQTTLAGMRIDATPPRRSWHVMLRDLLGRDWAAAYVFVLPTILLMGGLIAYPLLRAVYISFTNTVSLQTGPFVGLRNYENVWADRNFLAAVWITTRYTFWSVLLKFIFGLTAAILLHRLKRFGGILTAAILLPWIVPSVVAAIAWKGLLDPVYGGVNQFLIQTGMVEKGFPWLGSPNTALASLVMVNIWGGIPFFTINLLAGLKAIDKEYYEAAIIDGANYFGVLRHVIVPNAVPGLITNALLEFQFIWNLFFWPLIAISSNTLQVIQVAISSQTTQTQVFWGRTFAGAALASIPVILIFLALQRYYVQGVATTGLKG